MTISSFTPQQLRRRLSAATLFAAAALTPALWLVSGNLVGDFISGVWLGTVAAFVMVAGPLALPERPLLSRLVVVLGALAVGGTLLRISPVGEQAASQRTETLAPLIAFGVGAIAAHASWAAQINRLSRELEE